MAHYDCKNCGWPEGIEFGYCRNCTPREYFELEKQLNAIYAEAKRVARISVAAAEQEEINRILQNDGYHGIKQQMEELRKKHTR